MSGFVRVLLHRDEMKKALIKSMTKAEYGS